MREQCFSCGRFVSIGKGTTTRVKRFDGHTQCFCQPCVEEDEKHKGRPFAQSWTDIGKVTVV